MKKVRCRLKVPNVHHDSLLVKPPVRWLVLVPNAFHFESVGKGKKQNSEVDLSEELSSFDVKPPAHFGEVQQILLIIDSILDVPIDPLLVDLGNQVRANLKHLADFA